MVELDELGLPRPGLSARELEIIELVAKGLTNQEIATTLMISKRTVDNHVSNVFSKTGAKNRVALLDPDHANPDMVDEMVRKELNVAHPDEVIVPLK